MKTVPVALLAITVFTPRVFAQSVVEWVVESGEQPEHRFRTLSDWIEMVKGAERDYQNKNGRYGDLAALRKAHFLRSLAFESRSSAGVSGKAEANFVPKSTLFQVTVWADGQHFRAVINDMWVGVNTGDVGGGVTMLPVFCPINEMRE